VLAYAAAVRAKLDAIIADTQKLVEYEATLDSALDSAEAELAALVGQASAESQIYITADDVANLPILQDMSAVGITLPRGGSIAASALPSAAERPTAEGSAAQATTNSSGGASQPSTASAAGSSGQDAQDILPYRLLVAAAETPSAKKGVNGGSRRTQPQSSVPPPGAGTLDDVSAFLVSHPPRVSSDTNRAPPSSTDSLLALVRDGAVADESGLLSIGHAAHALRPSTDDGEALDALLADDRSGGGSPAAGPSLAALEGDAPTAPVPAGAGNKRRRSSKT